MRVLPWIIWLAACCLAGVFIACMAASEADARSRGGDFQCEHEAIPDEFDWAFAAGANRHFPVFWRNERGACIVKAICWIESRLDPTAMSQVGAQGLCQVMPATAADLEKRNIWRGNLRSAKDNAMASAAVYRQMWEGWTTPRSMECRHELSLGGYNAGNGNLYEAQVLSGGRLCFEGIAPYLHKVTGRHARETLNYIPRFWRAWRMLRGYGL